MSFKKILIAVDNSPCSMNAAKKGFDLANSLNIPVGLVFVIERSIEIINTDLDISPIPMPLQNEEFIVKQAEQTVDKIINAYGADHSLREIARFFPEGFPKEEILDTAKKWNADLLIMGTHGRTGLAHFFMGSTSEHIARHSGISVMIVPEQA